jgi:pyruvate dehydrogenase E1 component alpha subunit
MTFRFYGHLLGDADAYMDKAQKTAAMARDPVPALRAAVIAAGHAIEAQLAAMESAIEREIDDALKFALDSPFPDVSELRRDVYAQEVAA